MNYCKAFANNQNHIERRIRENRLSLFLTLHFYLHYKSNLVFASASVYLYSKVMHTKQCRPTYLD